MSNSVKSTYTRQAANEGRRVDIPNPDLSHSGNWVQVRHVNSDAFLKVKSEFERKAADLRLSSNGEVDKAALEVFQEEAKMAMLVAIVAGWSFDEPCTPEAVHEWLVEAPQVCKIIDDFAGDSQRFFGKESASSEAGSKAKKNSRKK